MPGIDLTGKGSTDTIVQVRDSGMSDEVEVGGRIGRFDFDVPPIIDPRVPEPMYTFVTREGDVWNFQVGKSVQGGRWEDATHARQDFERLKGLDSKKRAEAMQRMWGDSEIGKILGSAAEHDATFDELRDRLKGVNTHRQISTTDPIQEDGKLRMTRD